MIGSWKLNNHTGVESVLYSVFQTGDEIWVFIAGKNKLTVTLMKSIEKIKEFFLELVFTGKKLDVIHDDYVIFPILFFELLGFVCLKSGEIFRSESFRGQ